jgi:hypothetical protein
MVAAPLRIHSFYVEFLKHSKNSNLEKLLKELVWMKNRQINIDEMLESYHKVKLSVFLESVEAVQSKKWFKVSMEIYLYLKSFSSVFVNIQFLITQIQRMARIKFLPPIFQL